MSVSPPTAMAHVIPPQQTSTSEVRVGGKPAAALAVRVPRFKSLQHYRVKQIREPESFIVLLTAKR